MTQGNPLTGDPGGGDSRMLQNETPAMLVDAFYAGVGFVQTYGWFLVLASALLFYLKVKLEPTLAERRRKREEQEAYDFDAQVTRNRQSSMEAARQRMQDQLDQQAAEYAEKQRQKEEEKRQAKIEDWDRHQEGKGYRSKARAPAELPPAAPSTSGRPKPGSLRDNDYSPLSGGGGGGAFCRPRRMGGG